MCFLFYFSIKPKLKVIGKEFSINGVCLWQCGCHKINICPRQQRVCLGHRKLCNTHHSMFNQNSRDSIETNFESYKAKLFAPKKLSLSF